ncbi:hypothetical protein Ancab_019946 [Ancistrocladus abbreviatus]
MAVFARTRRATDPFNEKVRARIFGMSTSMSSGSEHDGENDFISPSPSSTLRLSHLVQNFLEDENSAAADSVGEREVRDNSDSEDESVSSDPTALIEDVIEPLVNNNADQFRNDLLSHVTKAVEVFSLFRKNKSVFNRNVMAYLREIGYNAGICKSKWNTSPGGGLTAGNYEFIDVIIQPQSTPSPSERCLRYFIDVDFAGEFEIARETENYSKMRNALPIILVGKAEELKRVVRVMCDEARRSMKRNGLSLPPWRKNRYMQAKWFGPYRRTVNQMPSPSSTAVHAMVLPKMTVKCRAVGFDTGIDGGGGRFFVTPATRTR